MTSRIEVAPERVVVTGGGIDAPIARRRQTAGYMLAVSFAVRQAYETGVNHAVAAGGTFRVVSAPGLTAPRRGIDAAVAVARRGRPRVVDLVKGEDPQ